MVGAGTGGISDCAGVAPIFERNGDVLERYNRYTDARLWSITAAYLLSRGTMSLTAIPS